MVCLWLCLCVSVSEREKERFIDYYEVYLLYTYSVYICVYTNICIYVNTVFIYSV